jgi:hypothetical protein
VGWVSSAKAEGNARPSAARPGTLLRSGRPPGRSGRLASTAASPTREPPPAEAELGRFEERCGSVRRRPPGMPPRARRDREPFFEAADLPVGRDALASTRRRRRHANRPRPRQSSAASRNGARLPAGRHREPFFEAADLPVSRDGSRPRQHRRHANRLRPRQSSAASRNGARLPAGRHREPFFEAADLPVGRDGSRPRQHRRHANRLRPRQSSAASRNGARLPAGRHREPFFEAADLPVGRDGSRPRQHRRHANRPRPRQSSAASRNGADQFGEGGRECPPERGTTRNPSSKRPTSRSAGTARVHGSIADTRTASVHPCAADSSSSRSRISSTSARIACARA